MDKHINVTVTGPACVLPEVEQKHRIIFWVVSVFILLLLAFPWYAPFFME